jgi:transmembrane sensor
MDINRFIQLLENYLENRIGEDDQQELFLMIASGKYDEAIRQRIDASFGEDKREMDPGKANEILTYITNPSVSTAPSENGRVVPMYKRKVFKWIAAAVVLLMIVGGWWIVDKKSTVDGPQITATTNDVEAPKETRAVITLANGSKVYLDSAANGTIAQENDVNVVKNNNGEIVYHSLTTHDSPLTFNTLFNPRGSKMISVTLADGSRVWLNAGSSIKYPVAFISKERKVEITGEAYFEVAHNASKPFIVTKGETSITVLGTHFNVNTYDDEDALRITLLEGSVAVKRESSNVKLKPGEQAVLSATSHSLLTTGSVDTDAVMAWKNGFFQFNNTPIDVIMRQVEKWYDVDVVYNGSIKQTFNGKIPRTVNASDLFKILESTGWVHFKIEGKKVMVTP